jgi:hypothetical protein
MAYHVYFSMSVGLAKPIQVPKGTLKAILEHIQEVETTLSLKRRKFKDNNASWDNFDPEYRDGFPHVDDELLCKTVSEHNEWVRRLYDEIQHWAEHPFPPPEGKQAHQADHWADQQFPVGWEAETITPDQAREFWCGLETLDVPVERWTRDYYRERMEHLYEVMRGRESEGVSFDVKALTERQAAQVINIFSTYLDAHDLRLDVPKGRDYLASSYAGGYTWCDLCCKPIAGDDTSCRRPKCPLREDNS